MTLPNRLLQKVSCIGQVQKEQAVRVATMMIVSLGLLTVSGCSTLNIGQDQYSCPGMPNGVQCLSAREVYAASNEGNVPLSTQPKAVDKAEADGGKPSSVSPHLSRSGSPVANHYVAPYLPDRPIPIRTPAQVMRIWIAPWEDTHGDLIVPGYVYTEIEPRRWVIGEGRPKREPALRPLQAVPHDTPSETTK